MQQHQFTPEQLAAMAAAYQQQQAQQQQAPAPAYPQQQAPSLAQPVQRGGLPSLKTAKVGNANGKNLPAGEHVLEIERVKIVKGFKQRGALFFVVEFGPVIESDTLPVGAKGFSWVKPFEDEYGYGPNDIKGFICSIVESKVPGSNPSVNWDDNFIAWIAEEDGQVNHPQPARGVRLHCSAWEKPKQKSAGNVTICDWRVIGEGEELGLSRDANEVLQGLSQHAPTPPAVPAPAPMPVPQQPAMPSMMPPVPGPQATAPGQVPPRPAGWPDSMPWPPGATQ